MTWSLVGIKLISAALEKGLVLVVYGFYMVSMGVFDWIHEEFVVRIPQHVWQSCLWVLQVNLDPMNAEP